MILLGLIAAAFVGWVLFRLLAPTKPTTSEEPNLWPSHALVTAESALLETFNRWDGKGVPDSQRRKLLRQMHTRHELPPYIKQQHTDNPEQIRTFVAISLDLRSVE